MIKMLAYSAISGLAGSGALVKLVDYATEKAAVLDECLAVNSHLSDELIGAAVSAAERTCYGDSLYAVGLGTVAAVFSGLTIYEATKRRGE